MANRLATETSPYLLQHANNPVDWYPWGTEALERARREDRPILLSIGYAACHWCHVMERESFEDEETARLMNELFVCIKVDREERPDLDSIYMQAVQAMAGQGGWPMTSFLTPLGEPFYGGTYFPPEDRHGLPSFRRVLSAVADAYRNRRGDVDRTVERMRELYAAAGERTRSGGRLHPQLLERAYRSLAQGHDARHGGFGNAPKFPQAMALDFLLRYWRRTRTAGALEIVRKSARAMARGGIFDQIGGGFHRYSVDAGWLVPHFEKMLYDNALLARLALHLHQATNDPEMRTIVEDTIEWVAREMTSPDGGFHSTLDADSEGEEGRFYVWSVEELDALLGEDAAAVRAYYGATPGGNFEGSNILHVRADAGAVAARLGMQESELRDLLSRARSVLLVARERRVRPARDDKILASWNGLMLRAIAEAARILDRSDFRELALRNAEFLFRNLVVDGRVMRVWAGGARLQGFLEDHAALGLAALSMYELTHDPMWVERATALTNATVRWFWSDEIGAFFDTASDHESLVTRPREITDNATPSGNSLAVELLLRISELRQDSEARRRATWVLETLADPMVEHAIAFGFLLGSADMEIHGAVEVALAGVPGQADFRVLESEVARHYLPALVLAGGEAREGIALLGDRTAQDGVATAYVCRRYACDSPTGDPALLAEQLERAATLTATTAAA